MPPGTYTFGDSFITDVTDGDLVAGGKLNLAYSLYDESGMFVTNNINVTNANPAWGNVTPSFRLTNQWKVLSNPVYHSRPQIHGYNGALFVTNVGTVPAIHPYEIGGTGLVYVVPIGRITIGIWDSRSIISSSSIRDSKTEPNTGITAESEMSIWARANGARIRANGACGLQTAERIVLFHTTIPHPNSNRQFAI
jgi:hypothetical protein